MFGVYADPTAQKRFVAAWNATGKKLDMGKACVRVKNLEDVPLEVVGAAIRGIGAKEFIATYEAVLPPKILEKHRARAGMGASGGVAEATPRKKAGSRAGAGAVGNATKTASKKKTNTAASKTKASKKASTKTGKVTSNPATKNAAKRTAKRTSRPAKKTLVRTAAR
jgi:hypothetical protein